MSRAAEQDIYYKALLTKDRRFDGRIFFGVSTTGIYCRPICPARTPLRKNVSYYPNAAAAEEAGFRPCMRCRPEASPGTPAWSGTSATVSRALRLIAAGVAEDQGIPGLSDRLGVGERQLRRLFIQHLGAPPQTVIRTRRLDFARKLIDETELPIAQVAFASGFESIRRFNDAFKRRFLRNPMEIRRGRALHAGQSSSLTLKLPYRPPFDWDSILGFLADRAIPGVEAVSSGVYLRTFSLESSTGWLSVRPSLSALELSVHSARPEHLMEIAGRIRRLFDLEADPLTIVQQLGNDAALGPIINKHPGLRVPGTWDGFELTVRAVLGQQVSIQGARTLVGRLVQLCGASTSVEHQPALTHLFPTPDQIAAADLSGIGVPSAKARTLATVARLLNSGELRLDSSADPAETARRLLEVPGVGPWTAEYISMRALRHPDAFPESDLVIKRELQRLNLRAAPESWRPWRAYAAICLWKGFALRQEKERKTKNAK